MENISDYNKVKNYSLFKNNLTNRNYFIVFLSLLFLIVSIGFITPILIESKKSDWTNILPQKTDEVATSIETLYKEKEEFLITHLSILSQNIISVNNENLLQTFSNSVSNYNETDFAVGLFDKDENLIGWNNATIFNEKIIWKDFPDENQTFFFHGQLEIYLAVWKQVESHRLFVAIPFEKFYKTGDQHISFRENLEKIIQTDVDVSYLPYSAKSKDGRKYSFDIMNNNQTKIGLITFIKPILNAELNELRDTINHIQSLLILIAFLVLVKILHSDVIKLENKWLRVVLFILNILGLRVLLFVLGLPSKFISFSLTDPTYFSSAFGYGIVKSPIELFITSLAFVIISIRILREIVDYFHNEKSRIIRSFIAYPLVGLLTILYFLVIRAFSAASKSVVFDSTLNFFENTEIIQSYVHFFMLTNLLTFSLFFTIVLISILIVILKLININHKIVFSKLIVILLFCFTLLSYLFYAVQKESLISFSLYASTALLTIAIVYLAISRKYNFKNTILLSSIIASILSISFINYFNAEIEKRALKTTSHSIHRTNHGYLTFMIQEALMSASNDEIIINSILSKNPNYNSLAFLAWNKSSFINENLNVKFFLLNKQKQVLGKFNQGNDFALEIPDLLKAYLPKGIKIFDLSNDEKQSNILAGINPIVERSSLLGYFVIMIDTDKLISFRNPGLQSVKPQNYIASLNHNILMVENGNTKFFSPNFYPTDEVTKMLLNANQTEQENWTEFSLRGEDYIGYISSVDINNVTKKILVAMKSKELSWSLFNFFKLLIPQFSLIAFFFVLINLKDLRKLTTHIYSFKIQILMSLLIVSIIPIIALAAYNRYNVTQKSEFLINESLSEKTDLLINHLTIQKKNNPLRQNQITFEKAAKELGISFRIYKDNASIFSTETQLVESSLISKYLPMGVYVNFSQNGFNEYFTTTVINGINHYTFYKKFSINDEIFIAEMNDAFNIIKATLAPIEIDVFLFGVYSFAILLIILMSTFLANKISSPLKKLTEATNAVAQGDLSVEIQNTEKGEIKALINGFNKMTSELSKYQKDISEIERELAWKDMAKQVAHEVKNPLTPMKLMVQQLIASYNDKTKPFDTIFEKVTSTLLNQIETLNQIASEFSQFARMPNYTLEKFDLIRVLNEYVLLNPNLTFEIVNNTSYSSFLINSDISQFRRMITNLIRNSIQAESTLLIITISQSDKFVELLFTDNGVGIEPEHLSQVFSLNFSTKKKGMGIGL
ncbi:MAG: HAMP domain-containing protein, partial [Ignavibacteriaceae bacterium]|nr:HAMP domain-containing protein [Ignavibacteriaceae bacterium]